MFVYYLVSVLLDDVPRPHRPMSLQVDIQQSVKPGL